MAESVKIKGHLIASAVPGVRGLVESGRAQLPDQLRHYLDDTILASSWYPIEDHLALLAVIVAGLDPATLGGRDPYCVLGRIAAARDLKGIQSLVPEGQKVKAPGIYRGMSVFSADLIVLIKRTLLARQFYYSAGRFVAKRTGERTVRIVLQDFPFVSAPLCSTIFGFFIEVFHSAIGARVEMVSCRACDEEECAWELRLGPEVDVSGLTALE